MNLFTKYKFSTKVVKKNLKIAKKVLIFTCKLIFVIVQYTLEGRKIRVMNNLRKVLFLFVAVMLTTVSVNAMSESELEEKLTKTYTINGTSFRLDTGDANKVKAYLAENEISESDCDTIASKLDEAIAIVEKSGVTNLKNLSTSEKNQIKALVNEVGSSTAVPVSISNGKLFVGYVSEPTKAFYNDKVDLTTDVKYTNANLYVTIASAVAVIGIIAIAIKAKKQNA